MMYEPKRLHPAGMIFNLFQGIRQSIVGLLPIAIVTVGNGEWLYVLLGAAILLVLFIVFSVLAWYRYTYQLEEDQIRIEQGIFIRKKRTISKHRIQSIDLSQNIIHRIFGLTKVQIETAGSDQRIDAALSAVTMEEGQLLHQQLKYNKQSEPVNEESEQQEAAVSKQYPQRKVSVKQLLIAGSTSASFGIILGLFGLVFSDLESLIPDRFYNQVTDWVVSQAMQVLIAFGILTFLILWCFGILQTLIQYWNFTITRYEKELFITRGLLEKKQSTIPLKRIQAVGIKESVIRQPLGFAIMYVEIASGEIGQNQEMHTLIFPLIRKKQVAAFLEELLPEYSYQPDNMTKLPKKALPYYLFRAAIFPLLATITVAVLFFEYAWIPLIITVAACLLGYLQFRSTAYKIKGEQLMVKKRNTSKDTILIQHKKLQSFQRKQHILHRKQKLATMDTAILNKFLGRHFILRELREQDLDLLADWYSYQKE
ncbi:PH domain-containing protein [Gracilibacillus caseinilyticus]|uniref:PH domain-containing protein n=1 Tax=Gracilibacillus caseinilyticus TaxID=2932256 RepID=A0ABY4EVQ9_9BACI|nr:PH domain-containing protein [Gracilibacillus caseinilyticus]UOQ48488.1 PH domain-containing protein [Gracilibacillus caseinilyticus]